MLSAAAMFSTELLGRLAVEITNQEAIGGLCSLVSSFLTGLKRNSLYYVTHNVISIHDIIG